MKTSSKGLLTQLTQFWNLLDDLAESDPECYKNFIQQELNEGKHLFDGPEPQLCLQTRILKPKENMLFINLCQWKMIPAPQSTIHPVPVSVGRPEHISEPSDSYTVVSVAYNPDVLQTAENDPVKKDQLIKMAMKAIEERLQFILSHSYHITKLKIKGSIQRMKQNLMGIQTDFTDLREKMRNEHSLEQMRSSTMSDLNYFPQLLLPKDQVSGKAGCLIEEISSTEVPVEMKIPAYELKVVKDQNKKPLKIELKVKLPGINSVFLCDLRVSEGCYESVPDSTAPNNNNNKDLLRSILIHSETTAKLTSGITTHDLIFVPRQIFNQLLLLKDDLLIEVSKKYRLHLNLPESIDTEMTTAKFIKDKSTLIITMPLA